MTVPARTRKAPVTATSGLRNIFTYLLYGTQLIALALHIIVHYVTVYTMSKRILFVIAAIMLLGAGLFLRAANAHSSRTQADTIIKNDINGTDTSVALASLKDFVNIHMGSSVSFSLRSAYDRAQAAAQTSTAPVGATSQVYADAQRSCAGKSDSITQARCNQAYIQQHLSAAPTPTPAPVPTPKLSDYQYTFIAPVWSPDIAGAVLLGAAVSLIFGIFIGRTRKKI